MPTWLFIAETAIDLGNALRVGPQESLFDHAQNVTRLILTFYVPLLWVTLAVVVWTTGTRAPGARVRA